MNLPADARTAGVKPGWIGYVGVDDVDAAAGHVRQLGGVVHVPPTDIPISAALQWSAIRNWQRSCWSSGYGRAATNPRNTRHRAISTGTNCSPPTGKRRSLSTASFLAGKMRAPTSMLRARIGCFRPTGKPSAACSPSLRHSPAPFWLYYFNVDDIDAAAKRVKASGGDILNGPMKVLEGNWIVECTDPQSVMFALVGQRARTPIGYFRTQRIGRSIQARDRRWSW